MPDELSTLHTSNLSNEELHSLCRRTIAQGKSVVNEFNPVAAAAFLLLETNNTKMGIQMMKSKKSDLTPLMNEVSLDRKTRWSEVKRNINTAEKGRDLTKRESARLLKLFLEPCWKNNTKPLNIQTSLYIEMFDLYNEDQAMQEYARTVGVDNMLAELEPVNLQYQTLAAQRATDEANGGPSASDIKASVVENYNDFCIAIESALKYTPSDAILVFFKQINMLRRNYARFAVYKPQPEEEQPTPAPTE